MKNATKDSAVKETKKVDEVKKLKNNSGSRILFKLPDGSIYYGQLAYFNEQGNQIKDVESLSKEEQDKLKLLRHGMGLQIFDLDEHTGKYSYKYEGNWVKDKMSLEGKIEYKNGDVYEGSFVANKYEGEGKFYWKGKDRYEGTWKDGQMDGKGCFYHREGFELRGTFICNYFVDEKNLLINPFTPKVMIEIFKKKGLEYYNTSIGMKAETFSIQSITITKVDNLNMEVENCFKHLNKVPFIVRSSK